MDIRIESIPAHCLLHFAQEHLTPARQQPIAAITRHRALAHSVNPHASADDIGLFVAYSNAACVGYLGMLPTYLIDGRDARAVSFMSTFYVTPEYRQRRVAFALLNESVRLNRDLIVTDYTPESGRLYQALGFATLGHIDYLVLRAPGGVTPRQHWLTCRAMVADAKPARVARVDSVPATDDCCLPNERPRFCRNAGVMNWMLKYPWVLEQARATDPPYHFSDVRPIFRQLAMRIDDRSGASGILIVSFTERSTQRIIRMLDCYAPTDAMYATFLYVMCTCAARFLADEVRLPGEMQPHVRRLELPSEIMTSMRRDYLYHPPACGHSAIPSDLGSLHLSYCDGDTAFT
jgi:GNAT superfamily N-acetyltransferase